MFENKLSYLYILFKIVAYLNFPRILLIFVFTSVKGKMLWNVQSTGSWVNTVLVNADDF